MLRTALVSALLAAAAACTPVERDPACIAADACDQALERPFGDFGAQDLAFGDDLNANGTAAESLEDVGTCWQNAETSAVCAAECTRFLTEQQDIAKGQGNDAVFEACGGVLDDEDAGEGEGEGE